MDVISIFTRLVKAVKLTNLIYNKRFVIFVLLLALLVYALQKNSGGLLNLEISSSIFGGSNNTVNNSSTNIEKSH